MQGAAGTNGPPGPSGAVGAVGLDGVGPPKIFAPVKTSREFLTLASYVLPKICAF
jgi:hypothetical protein